MKSAKLLILAYRTLKKGHVSIAEKIVEEALSDESAPALMETLYSIINKEDKIISDIDDGTVDNKNNDIEEEDSDVENENEDDIDLEEEDIDTIESENQSDILGTEDEVKTMEKTAEDLPDTETQLEGKEVKKAEDLPDTETQLEGKEVKKVEDLPDTETQLEGKDIKKAEDLPSTKDQIVDVEIADVLTKAQVAQLKAIINRISSKGNKKDLAKKLIANLLKSGFSS